MLLPCSCVWLLLLAIVADVKANVFVYLWKTTYLMYCLVVAMSGGLVKACDLRENLFC